MRRGVLVLVSGGLDSSVLLHHIVQRFAPTELYGLSFCYGQRHERELDMARKQMETVPVSKEHIVQDISFYGHMLNGASALVAGGQTVPSMDAVGESEKDQPPTYVPNRNMVFLGIAAGLAESRECEFVYYAAHRQDEYSYWDCTPEFVEKMNAVLELNRRKPVQIQAPFIFWKKADIIREGVRVNVDFSRTWSCYKGDIDPCGSCPTCRERDQAFKDAGIPDPLLVTQEKDRN